MPLEFRSANLGTACDNAEDKTLRASRLYDGSDCPFVEEGPRLQSLPAFLLPFLLRLRGALRLLARAFARASALLFRHLSHLQPRRVMTLIK